MTIVRKNLPHCKKVKVKSGNSNGEVLRKIRATDSRNLEHLQQSASNNNLTHLRWKKLQRHVVNSNGGIISPSNHSAPHLLVNTRSNHQTVIKSWTVSWTLIKPYYFDVVLIHYYKVAVELRNRTCNCMIFILNYFICCYYKKIIHHFFPCHLSFPDMFSYIFLYKNQLCYLTY